MMKHEELGTLFDGLRAVITIADENYRIVHMNDLAIEHYGDRGGVDLIGTDLLDCHNAESQAQIRELYARHRAGDLTPTRYHEIKDDGTAESIVLFPLIVDGQFRGIAELMWKENTQ
jgi:PAS domain-containing protein